MRWRLACYLSLAATVGGTAQDSARGTIFRWVSPRWLRKVSHFPPQSVADCFPSFRQGEEALQMYVDSAPNMGGMGGFGSMGSKELRQQPYPVDVISSQLYNRLGGVPGGGHEHQHR